MHPQGTHSTLREGPWCPSTQFSVPLVHPIHKSPKDIITGHQSTCNTPTEACRDTRGSVAGPAGPALARPLVSGLLVSSSDCRDSLRRRRLGQVSHASSPSPCGYVFLVIVPALLLADQSLVWPAGLHRYPRILIPQVVFTAAHCLL